MAFVTLEQARSAARGRWGSLTASLDMLTKSARAPMTEMFDIFLSHAYEDAQVIAGIKALLENEQFSVYVDWIEDAQLDRTEVTAITADTLRKRMRRCRFLLYASSKSSTTSKWMPWEVGYFDALRGEEAIGILPIVQSRGSTFPGQEYLNLYPKYELIDFRDYGTKLGKRLDAQSGELLRESVRSIRVA